MRIDLSSAELPGLSAEDHVRGAPENPPVVIYADFTCPHCAVTSAALQRLPARVVFRHFALRSRHPRSVALAHAAEAAACQGMFWEMHDSLFGDPGHVDDPHLWERVRVLGLDLERFQRDRHEAEVAARVARDVHSAMRAGVAATPTLFVAGRAHAGPRSVDELAELVDGAGA
jgi:protein-disulfide isomerase